MMGSCWCQASLVLADCMRCFMLAGVCQPRVCEARVQAACVLLGDDVPARLHWPRHAELRVNNMQYRPYGRSGAMRLGANARDEPASIGTLCFHGRNALSLSAADNRPFCLVVQVRHAVCRQGYQRFFLLLGATCCRCPRPTAAPSGSWCRCGMRPAGRGVKGVFCWAQCAVANCGRQPPLLPCNTGAACCCGRVFRPAPRLVGPWGCIEDRTLPTISLLQGSKAVCRCLLAFAWWERQCADDARLEVCSWCTGARGRR